MKKYILFFMPHFFLAVLAFSCKKEAPATSKTQYEKTAELLTRSWQSVTSQGTYSTEFLLSLYFDPQIINKRPDLAGFYKFEKLNDFQTIGRLYLSNDSLYLISQGHFYYNPSESQGSEPVDTSIFIIKSLTEKNLTGTLTYKKKGVKTIKEVSFY